MIQSGETYRLKAFSVVEVFLWTREIAADRSKWPTWVEYHDNRPTFGGAFPPFCAVVRHSANVVSELLPGCVILRCLGTGAFKIYYEEKDFLEDYEISEYESGAKK